MPVLSQEIELRVPFMQKKTLLKELPEPVPPPHAPHAPRSTRPAAAEKASPRSFKRIAVCCLTLLVILGAISGCASRPVAEDELAPQTPLIWPGPPAPARIVYIRSISSPDDIGAKKGIFGRLVEFVLGKGFNNIIKPYGVATDSAGRMMVADTAFKRIHIFDLKEGKYSYIDSAGDLALNSPIDVAVDPEDNIYVSDSDSGKLHVYNKKGRYLFSMDAGKRPTGIAINPELGHIYVVDTPSHQLKVFDLEGKSIRTFGGWGNGPGQFNHPVDVFIDAKGDVYVTDSMNYRVQIFDKRGKYLTSFGHHGDGTGDFGRPKGVAVDADGNIYIADALFDTVQIFSRNGDYLLSFGTLGAGRGMFWMPGGLYIDSGDRIYVADSYNRRIQIFEYLGDSEVAAP